MRSNHTRAEGYFRIRHCIFANNVYPSAQVKDRHGIINRLSEIDTDEIKIMRSCSVQQ